MVAWLARCDLQLGPTLGQHRIAAIDALHQPLAPRDNASGGSVDPSRAADIRLGPSVMVVCRPVPMAYPGRVDGRAPGAHNGLDVLDVEIVMGGSAVPVHREGLAGDHGATHAPSRGGNVSWISCSGNRGRTSAADFQELPPVDTPARRAQQSSP